MEDECYVCHYRSGDNRSGLVLKGSGEELILCPRCFIEMAKKFFDFLREWEAKK